MKFTRDISDRAVLKELGSRIARVRLNSNLTQSALAKEAGVSQRTLIRVEHGESTQTSNLMRILRALHILENFEALIPEPAISPIQQLQLHGKSRKRASPQPGKSASKKPWSWGDGK
jgi:transcriptional regulator with XRE-family HTH domain